MARGIQPVVGGEGHVEEVLAPVGVDDGLHAGLLWSVLTGGVALQPSSASRRAAPQVAQRPVA